MPQRLFFPQCTSQPTFVLPICLSCPKLFSYSFEPEVPLSAITLQFFHFLLSRAQAHVLPSISPCSADSTLLLSAFLSEGAVMAREEHSFLFSYVSNMHFAMWVPLVQRKSVCYSLLSEGVTSNKQRGICYVFVANKGF